MVEIISNNMHNSGILKNSSDINEEECQISKNMFSKESIFK